MASGNVLRNRKRFVSERLDAKGGEQILFGSVDGEAMVLDDWWELNNRARLDRLSSRMNRTRMTLIPTNRRVVFYQANDWLMPDRMAEIPLGDLRDVTFDLYAERGRRGRRTIYALAAFVTDRRSPSASVMFRTEITDLFTFNAERRVVLPGICRLAGIPLSDITDYDMVEDSGISLELTNRSRTIYDEMLRNGEVPEDAAHVALPDPDAPIYDGGRNTRRGGQRRRDDSPGRGYGPSEGVGGGYGHGEGGYDPDHGYGPGARGRGDGHGRR